MVCGRLSLTCHYQDLIFLFSSLLGNFQLLPLLIWFLHVQICMFTYIWDRKVRSDPSRHICIHLVLPGGNMRAYQWSFVTRSVRTHFNRTSEWLWERNIFCLQCHNFAWTSKQIVQIVLFISHPPHLHLGFHLFCSLSYSSKMHHLGLNEIICVDLLFLDASKAV